ncbi:dihydroxyacetone kinase subunit DhaL [Saccharococcus caldoxylosilyticus]|uniref:phosphoenolpyruvate--glycerone phosphotransferase n=2 Tax=Saccharococcus caldoxylosilyticus TaxID=81408 RepID=A0A023DJ44_9BACL|nr:dihydroxyacetone kinase subunit DhaL [Parageobacillus caldoxylosilyticus]KYD14288.1 Phosphoenolpyruvate-dihydroxyacetone phosphotransferase, ADP-binding subunit DhaL [Parageobacillus caldoxylosilyticus]MBB3854191.1 dihydroxyacetone kinase-like protein [Parageobacillus caldoxylosilyticus]GAJ41263.1 dihydroxyacetone kinase nucleotide-binding subunit DhaL [Parageobacillus caldoxylosilyticus NBRC 107762]
MAFGVEQAKRWMSIANDHIQQQKQYLTELDQAIGDGDHGLNMARGFQEVVEKIASANYEDLGSLFKDISMTLIAKVGGASGPLYGTAFLRMSLALAGKKEADDKELIAALEAALDGIKARGKANVGEKTMVDVWEPVMEFLREKESLQVKEAALLAKEKMEHTKELEAKKGRAAYLGKRSVGHIDPGSASSHLLFAALAEALEG